MVMSCATALSDSSAFLCITSNVPTSQHNRAPFQELYKHNQADFAQVMRPVVKRAFQPRAWTCCRWRCARPWTPWSRAARAGEPGHSLQRVPGRGGRRVAADLAPQRAHRPGASEADLAGPWPCWPPRARPCSSSDTAPRCPGGRGDHRARRAPGHPSSPRPTAWAASAATTRWPWASSAATAPTRRTRPAAAPTLVITLGTRFDDRSSSSWHERSLELPKTRLVHVDIDPQELGPQLRARPGRDRRSGLRAPADQGLAPARADLGRALRAWRSRCAAGRRSGRPSCARTSVTPPARCAPSSWWHAAAVLPDDVILALDSGVHHNWFMQFWQSSARKACSTAGATPAWASVSAA